MKPDKEDPRDLLLKEAVQLLYRSNQDHNEQNSVMLYHDRADFIREAQHQASQSPTSEAASMVTLGRERREWQPIETAPRDETEILIKTSIGVVSAWFHSEPDEYYQWVCYDDKFTIDGDCGSVTHWMPLPSAPQSASQPTTSLTEEGDERMAALKAVDKAMAGNIDYEHACLTSDTGPNAVTCAKIVRSALALPRPAAASATQEEVALAQLIKAGNILAKEAFAAGIVSQVEAWDKAADALLSQRKKPEQGRKS